MDGGLIVAVNHIDGDVIVADNHIGWCDLRGQSYDRECGDEVK